jgi:hypothetical protein
MDFTKTRSARRTKTRKTRIKNKDDFEKNIRIVTPDGHIFNVVDEFENKIRVVPNNKSTSCIQILIDKDDKLAILQEVSYYSSCSMKKDGLSSKDGTRRMCQTILKYLVDTYPFIERVDINDKSAYNITKDKLSFITARYLLQGKQGLYQQYLNAKPTPETLKLINLIEEKRADLNKIIPQIKSNDWWSSENIIKLIDYVYDKKLQNYNIKRHLIKQKITSNYWFVDKQTIEQYKVSYSKMRIRNFAGGFKYNDNFALYINNIIPTMFRQIFPKE